MADESEKKGFGGLSSLVSKVEEEILPTKTVNTSAASKPEKTSTTVTNESSVRTTTQVPQPLQYSVWGHSNIASSLLEERQIKSTPSPQKRSPASGRFWTMAAIGFGILLLVAIFNAGLESNNQSGNNRPSKSTYSGTSSTSSGPAGQPAIVQPQAPSRPSESKPSVGRNNVLSTAQIRYCLAEKIRLDAAETVLNNYSDSDVDRFNGYVNDYNSRCGEFRYRQGALESARRNIDAYRNQLQAEGRSRFVRSSSSTARVPVPTTQRVPASTTAYKPSRPTPDATVLAIQRQLNELGYDSGTPDGLFGKKTRGAIQAFQRDIGVTQSGNATEALLRQLSDAAPNVYNRSTTKDARTTGPASPPSGLHPLNQSIQKQQCISSTECAGSNLCLDGHCRAARSVGERCISSTECAGSNLCLDGHCRAARSVGERCISSTECAGSNLCLDGHCRAARSVGERCISSTECAGSNLCLDGYCQPARGY